MTLIRPRPIGAYAVFVSPQGAAQEAPRPLALSNPEKFWFCSRSDPGTTMARNSDILRLGRRDLRFVHQAGVYVLAQRRQGGRTRLMAVGQSDHIARDARAGDGALGVDLDGVEEAIVVLERDPAARRRLAIAVAAALADALLPLAQAPPSRRG